MLCGGDLVPGDGLGQIGARGHDVGLQRHGWRTSNPGEDLSISVRDYSQTNGHNGLRASLVAAGIRCRTSLSILFLFYFRKGIYFIFLSLNYGHSLNFLLKL